MAAVATKDDSYMASRDSAHYKQRASVVPKYQ